ncbi:MAG: hypothetical protein KKA64_04625 [Nanoarchaeota archaeon]|nr:hypothetical protein [Nanoarchaeota archaeon]
MITRIKEVAFADENLKKAYFKLREGKFEDKQMFDFINRAIDDLKQNPLSGTRVPNHLIPKEYIKKYGVDNLWKYNFPNAWRLTYTLSGDSVTIVSVILEWMSHKEYERRFGYG